MIQGHGDDGYRYEDIRINFSSNIYAHADLSGLKAHLASRLDLVGRYPEPEPYSLERLIAERRGIPAECVLVTNGATEAIYLIAQMLSSQGISHYSIPQPTFSEYEDACRMFGMTPGEGGAQWLCCPNNPTGQAINYSCVPSVASDQRSSALFTLHSSLFTILDQSYEDFCLQPLMSPAEAVARGNVIQIHSLTKTYAVPGLRIGYVVSAAATVDRIRAFVRPWSVNALAIEAGRWLITSGTKAVPDVAAYLAEAQRLNHALNQIPHFRALPTDTHFMLVRCDLLTAAELKDRLARQYGILIRDASNFPGLDAHHFRIAAQRPDENDRLLAALRVI